MSKFSFFGFPKCFKSQGVLLLTSLGRFGFSKKKKITNSFAASIQKLKRYFWSVRLKKKVYDVKDFFLSGPFELSKI